MVYRLKKIVVLTALMFITGIAMSACDANNVSNLSGQQVVSNVQAAVASLNTFHGTVSMTATSPMLTGGASFTAEVWAQKPNLGRVEIKSITMPTHAEKQPAGNAERQMPNLTGATLVFDGSKAWLYIPTDNHVYTGNIDGQQIANLPTQMLTQLPGKIDQLLSQADIKVVGDAQVNGRDTTEIQLTPKPGTTLQMGDAKSGDMKSAAAAMLLSNSKLTLWVDKTINLPVQIEIDTPMGKATITSSGDEFNQPIAPDKFTFTPPAGATVTTIDTSKAEHKSLDSVGKNK
jgi:outer membrane lipoprotein-sorting protein